MPPNRLLVIVLWLAGPALLSACSDGHAPTAPDSPIVLENTELLSGGEGLLRSADFAEFELAPAVDTAGTVVSNRWTNFRVEVDGVEVDSWRAGADAIGFHAPVDLAGTATVDVTGDRVVPASFSVARRGLIEALRYDPCFSVTSIHVMPVALVPTEAGDAVVLNGACWILHDTVITSAYYRVRPPIEGSFEALSGTSDVAPTGGDFATTLRMYTPGTTYVPGMLVMERRADAEGGSSPDPDLWRARVGADLELVEPVTCPAFPDRPFTVAELAEGVCLTIDDRGVVRRNGVEIFDLHTETAAPPPVRIVTTPDGRGLPTGLGFFGAGQVNDDFPVFAADGTVEYTLSGFGDRTYVFALWAPAGDEFFAFFEEPGAPAIVERRDATTGELLASRGFENVQLGGAAFVGDALWVAGKEDGPGGHGGILHVLHPQALASERVLHLPGPPAVEQGAVVIPDPTGRRAYIVTHWDVRLYGFIVEVY